MNSILIINLIGVPVIFILGSLFHFLYKYSGKKIIFIPISPVNESIWEHLKIAFYPALIYLVIKLIVINNLPGNILTADIIGIYFSIIFILVAEWIYPSILKRNILILDLFVFFIAILIGQVISYYLLTTFTAIKIANEVVLLIIVIQSIIFTLLSIKPLKLPIFKDSLNGKYGIK